MKQFIRRVKSLKQNNQDAFGQFLFAVTIMTLNLANHCFCCSCSCFSLTDVHLIKMVQSPSDSVV